MTAKSGQGGVMTRDQIFVRKGEIQRRLEALPPVDPDRISGLRRSLEGWRSALPAAKQRRDEQVRQHAQLVAEAEMPVAECRAELKRLERDNGVTLERVHELDEKYDALCRDSLKQALDGNAQASTETSMKAGAAKAGANLIRQAAKDLRQATEHLQRAKDATAHSDELHALEQHIAQAGQELEQAPEIQRERAALEKELAELTALDA